jgi:hypothetical protein
MATRATKEDLEFLYWMRMLLSIKTCDMDDVWLKSEIKNGQQQASL